MTPEGRGGASPTGPILGGMAPPLLAWTGGIAAVLGLRVSLGTHAAAANPNPCVSPPSPDGLLAARGRRVIDGALVSLGLVERVKPRRLTIPSNVCHAHGVGTCVAEAQALRASADAGDR